MKKKPARKIPDPASLRRSTLDPTKRDVMLVILMRNPTAHAAVRDLLTPDKLMADDPAQALVWRTVCEFYIEHAELPSEDVLTAEVQDAITAAPNMLSEEEIENVQQLVDRTFHDEANGDDIATSETRAKWAIKTAREFLEDRLSIAVQDKVHDAGTLPADLPAMLRTVAEEADVIASLQTKRSDPPFPKGWDKAGAPKLFTTGIPVFDAFLGGGHKAGEVNEFMGPYGSCKTTVAVQAIVGSARYAAALAAEPDWDGTKALAVLVSYETPIEELRQRCLSCAALIPRDRVEEAMTSTRGLNYFSNSTTRLTYENELFRAQILAGEPIQCERTRAKAAVKLLNRHAHFMDMTGSDPQRRGAGNGYVPEISRALEHELRQRKNTRLLVVWVDYLGALAKRHLEATAEDYRDLRHRLSGGILMLGNLVAKPFQCPVWVNHQLSGDANTRGPTARMHHTDAAEAKNVAENADFAIVTGNVTEEDDQFCVFACTKHRRQPPRQNAVVRVEGQYCRVADVSADYVVDRNRRAIVTREDYEGWHGSAYSANRANRHNAAYMDFSE